MWAWPLKEGHELHNAYSGSSKSNPFCLLFWFFALCGMGEVPGVHRYFPLTTAFLLAYCFIYSCRSGRVTYTALQSKINLNAQGVHFNGISPMANHVNHGLWQAGV